MSEEMILQDPVVANMAMTGWMAGIIVVFSVLLLGLYVLQSIGLMQMAKNAGIENAWLSFIPLASSWIIGELVSAKLGGSGGLKVLLGTGAAIVVSFIPVIGSLLVLGATVWIYYLLYSKYSDRQTLHTVLSLFIPVYFSIAIFVLRNKPALY